MSLLRPGSHPPPILIALCFTIIGFQWFSEPMPQTRMSGPAPWTTNSISGVARETPGASDEQSAPDQSQLAGLREAYGRVPLSFEVNRGQTDPQVKFLSRGSG